MAWRRVIVWAARARRPYLAGDRPMLFAHRGGSALAPENTLVAFERGLAHDVDALELDVRPTRDGELVVFHDPTLSRTTNGSGLVVAHTLDDLRQLDAGYRFTPDRGGSYPYRGRGVTIPTLREVLARFPTSRLNIGMKLWAPRDVERLWQLIQEFGAQDRVLVASFLRAPLVRFRRISKGRVATAASWRETYQFMLAAYANSSHRLRPHYDALQVPLWRAAPLVTQSSVAAAHRLGLAVHVWVVDDGSNAEHLLALGVDGLMTNRPDVMRHVCLAGMGHLLAASGRRSALA